MKLVRVFPNLSAENKSTYRNRQEAIITCISPVFYLISRNDNQADKMKIIADNTVPHHDSHDRVRPYRYPLLREGRDHVEERPGLQRRFRGAICIILFGSRRPPQRRETSREDYRYRWRRPCREYRGEAMRGHGDACASQ